MLSALGPMVEAVEATAPGRGPAVLDALHEVYLELVVHGRIGPKAPDLGLELCLKRVLGGLPARLAADPGGLARAAVRALGARADEGLTAQLAWVEAALARGDLPGP